MHKKLLGAGSLAVMSGIFTAVLIMPALALAVVGSNPNPTTNAPSGISQTDATLNGTNGDTDATHHSFWVSTATFSTASPTLPPGVYSTHELGPVAAGAGFTGSLSLMNGMPAVTPGTTYYVAAWVEIEGTWYPGGIESFITAAEPAGPVFIDTDADHALDPGETTFATIQAAVDAANAGDTIQATAGTYAEHVVVGKPLTINGAQVGIDARTRAGSESVVDGTANGTPFAVQANDVTIDGFTIANGQNGGYYSGIWMADPTGAFVLNNIFADNSFGIWADCGGDCLIEHNLFNSDASGPSGSAGISADSTIGLSISENEFENLDDGNPILLQAVAAGAHTRVEVTGNSFHDNASSNIYVLGTTGGTFSGNAIAPAGDATGISFSGLDADITVTNNVITGGARGVRIEDAGYYGESGGSNSNIAINRNSLASDTEYGVGNLSGYAGDLDATCNWWGAADGPGLVAAGSGSPVTANVSFSSWLTTSDLDGVCGGAPVAEEEDDNGSSGGGSRRNTNVDTGGEVLGAETGPDAAQCDRPLFTTYMKMGDPDNNASQVILLQWFLNGEMGSNLALSGFFGSETDQVVKQFQVKYAGQVLAPWGLTEGTGWVYKFTQRRINLIGCSGLVIPVPTAVIDQGDL